MGLTLITAPAEMPISLAEAKLHLRVDTDDEDALITMLISAATAHLDGRDGILGRCLVTQTWEWTFDAFPAGDFELPLAPVVSVDSVKYLDDVGNLQTMVQGVDYYREVGEHGWIVGTDNGWPVTYDNDINCVRVRFTAGYGGAAAVPAPLRAAILLHVGTLFRDREATGDRKAPLPMAYDALTRPYRAVRFA